MPLAHGSSREVVSRNISEMVHAGHPRKQAIAAALRTAREKRASGGAVEMHVGPITSAVAGRTDHLPMHVPSGSYVIPADIVSAMGEGNTMAGFRVLNTVLAPYGGKMQQFSRGGMATGKVPIVAAGGEYVIDPATIAALGGGDIDAGHRALDDFVVKYRKKTIQALRKLPPPKKS